MDAPGYMVGDEEQRGESAGALIWEKRPGVVVAERNLRGHTSQTVGGALQVTER